jgi:hypothetical protein
MGIRNEELKNLVLPLISIDEFEPKLGTTEEVIVVAFYCKDELPAYDLDDFIDKSVVEVLDSEVSPNPDTHGNYLVFVEFKRQPNFWTKLYKLLDDIERVTGEMEWRVKPYLSDKKYPLKSKEIQKLVITRVEEYVPKSDFNLTMEDYLRNSDLTGLEITEGYIVFERSGQKLVLDLVDFGDTEELTEKLNLKESYLDLMATSSALTNLRSMLGEGWDISTIDTYFFITHNNDNRSIVVRRK